MILNSSFIPAVTYSRIVDAVFEHKGIDLHLARLDQLPPPAGGNKWFKLKYNLLEAQSKGFKTLITFGGAYSNHLYATAEAAHHLSFQNIGIVRGEETLPLNDTLAHCKAHGMDLYYMSREGYRKKNDPGFVSDWLRAQGIPFGYLIPEGGSNSLAVKGVAELAAAIPEDTDIVVTACGTGGTLAGLITGMLPSQQAWGVSALQGGEFLYDEVKQLLSKNTAVSGKTWEIIPDYAFGGYAKCPDELLRFIKSFYKKQGILLDPIYTGKMMYGIFDLAHKNVIPKGKKIVALHTGGIQAWNGMPEKKMYISGQN